MNQTPGMEQPKKSETTPSLNTSVTVEASMEVVLDLLKLENLTKFNPLINSFRLLETTSDIQKAEIVDSLPMGLFTYKLTYEGTQEILEETKDHVVLQNNATSPFFLAPGKPLLVKNRVTVSRTGENTSINEDTILLFPDKPSLVPPFIWDYFVNYAFEKAKESHSEMYIRLKDVAEGVSVEA